MKIGNVETNSNVFLAPMAGVTDVGFRFLARKFGAGLSCTEMISARGLLHNSAKTKNMLEIAEKEHPCSVQLFGKNPSDLANACQHEFLEKFDIIDLNMGCPAPKIVKNGEGSSLLKNFNLAEEIIRSCVSVTKKPITVKFRIGFNDGDNVAVDFAKMCERAGASAICVHGRTRSQMYSGKVNYNVIREVKKAVKIPVIGNGDVVDKQSLDEMLETGVDGVMIGRASLGRPWIFSIVEDKMTNVDILACIETHVELLRKCHKDDWINKYMRKHILWYLKPLKITTEMRTNIISSKTLNEMLRHVRKCFE